MSSAVVPSAAVHVPCPALPLVACPRRIRVAVICDFAEEGWTSMDLVGEMLFQQLQHADFQHDQGVGASLIRPRMRRLSPSMPRASFKRVAFNGERVINRYFLYPRHLKRELAQHDVFHIVDHSYAHLAHQLPADRTVVTCHDTDAFRCLLADGRGSRSLPFRRLTRHIFAGLRRAAWITCDTQATRENLLQFEGIHPAKISVVHNGVDNVFSPATDRDADAAITEKLGTKPGESFEILHVGSTIARKRLHVLLRVFELVRERYPFARLIRVGGAFRHDQARLTHELGIDDSIQVLPPLQRRELAAIYRRADILLLPSQAEGFGLPVIEAMASGTPMLVSDIPALREVGGGAAEYCEIAGDDEIQRWAIQLSQLWEEKQRHPERWDRRVRGCLDRARAFSWAEYARSMAQIYTRLLQS